MPDIAIRVDNLSKLYSIGERERYCTLRETLSRFLAAPFCRYRRESEAPAISNGSLPLSRSNNRIWALKDVSFEIKCGEVVGIIGRNGAGKSTLLKILSRIIEPTNGEAKIYGRVGSLLEVGTGFHLELTGRENIYLNGAILGMRKAEISRKFDEIVVFAEVERFIDIPVKRYSSGMYMRLAFSVAAHLESEVLLVDEVLAVGDAAFQKRCLGKIGDVAKQGRTVFFISHNLAAIEHMCGRVILLESGKVQADTTPDAAILEYQSSFTTSDGNHDLGLVHREPDLLPIIQRMQLFDRAGHQVTAVPVGSPLRILIHYRHSKPIKDASFGIIVETLSGVRVFLVQTRLQKGPLPSSASHRYDFLSY